VISPYFLVAELAPLMTKRGEGSKGNVSTMAAEHGSARMSLYGASRAAINVPFS